MKRTIIILLLFCFVNFGFSQKIEYKKAKGARAFNAIQAICDNSGSILSSSATGQLLKITNGTFENIDIPGAEASFCVGLVEDKKGRIWVSTYHGTVLCYDGKTWEKWEKVGYLTTMAVDKYNNIWGAGGGRIYKYDGKEWKDYLPEDKFPNFVSSMVCEEDTVWIAAHEIGLVKFDGQNWTTYPMNGQLNQSTGIAVTIDNKGTKWVSSRDFGVCKFNGSSWEAFSKVEYPNLTDVESIKIDHKGVIWVCSSSRGVSFLEGEKWINISYEDGLMTNSYSILCIDNENSKWFFSTQGISCYNEEKIVNYLSDYHLNGDEFVSMFFDSQNRIWISSFEGTTVIDSLKKSKYILNEDMLNTYSTVIREDKAGDLWFGTTTGVWRYRNETWTKFTTTDGLINNFINDIAIDSYNNKWFATNTGVSRFDGKNWINYSEADGLPNTTISYIEVDSKDRIWVSAFSKNNNLAYFDGKLWNTEGPKLDKENFILSMKIDMDDNVWLGTRYGLYSYDYKAWINHVYNDKPGHTISDIAITPQNNIVFLEGDKDIRKYSGNSFGSFNGFEDFYGGIIFDFKGNAWGINSSVIQCPRIAPYYLVVPFSSASIYADQDNEMTFTLSTNTMWKINCDQDWINFNIKHGEGSNKITITADENKTGEERVAAITFMGAGVDSQEIKIYQKFGNTTSISDINTSGKLTVKRQANTYIISGDGFKSVAVYSINGAKVAESIEPQLNVSNLQTGMYILRILKKNGSFESHKIIVSP